MLKRGISIAGKTSSLRRPRYAFVNRRREYSLRLPIFTRDIENPSVAGGVALPFGPLKTLRTTRHVSRPAGAGVDSGGSQSPETSSQGTPARTGLVFLEVQNPQQ